MTALKMAAGSSPKRLLQPTRVVPNGRPRLGMSQGVKVEGCRGQDEGGRRQSKRYREARQQRVFGTV